MVHPGSSKYGFVTVETGACYWSALYDCCRTFVKCS